MLRRLLSMVRNRSRERTAISSSRLAVASTLFLMVTLSSYDGNILLLAASGVILQLPVLTFTGLFSVGGPGAWFAAFSRYSRKDCLETPGRRRELMMIVTLSYPIITSACLAGVILHLPTHPELFDLAGGFAVMIVGGSIIAGRSPPSVGVLGRRIPIPTVLVVLAAGAEGLVFFRPTHIESITQIAGRLLTLDAAKAFLCASALWGIGLGSVSLFTLLPADKMFNKPVLGYFGGAAILLIGATVAGVPASSVLFSQQLAPFGVDLVFCIGIALSALVRRATGVAGWTEGDETRRRSPEGLAREGSPTQPSV